jgi:hypothetical protein
LIDYISPIYKGNFNLFTGHSNFGQKQILNQIALNFLDTNKYSNNNFLIYITHSKKESIKLEELFRKLNEKNKLSNDKFIILTVSDNHSENEHYYLPHTALNLSKSLIQTGVNILLCHDDITNFIIAEKNIFNKAKCCIASTNVLADIREQCGVFSSPDYSFTSIMISEKNKINYEFQEDYNKTINNIASFSDKIVNFECNINFLKSK